MRACRLRSIARRAARMTARNNIRTRARTAVCICKEMRKSLLRLFARRTGESLTRKGDAMRFYGFPAAGLRVVGGGGRILSGWEMLWYLVWGVMIGRCKEILRGLFGSSVLPRDHCAAACRKCPMFIVH